MFKKIGRLTSEIIDVKNHGVKRIKQMKDMDLIKIIRNSLNNRKLSTIDNSKSHFVHSSVLIPILKEDSRYSVLFTRRTNKMEHHKGQISFPGGAVDKEDGSFEETAFREAHEEIGLLKKDVEMLGRIDDELAVVSSFIIHPFVGGIPYPYDFQINVHEVDSIIIIPFYIFLDKTSLYKKDFVNVEGYPYHGTNYQFEGSIIWGATARIMENLIGIIEDKIKLA
jgi:8-oxo-dGTP pyrophosphatase MutT (NUDIX family)